MIHKIQSFWGPHQLSFLDCIDSTSNCFYILGTLADKEVDLLNFIPYTCCQKKYLILQFSKMPLGIGRYSQHNKLTLNSLDPEDRIEFGIEFNVLFLGRDHASSPKGHATLGTSKIVDWLYNTKYAPVGASMYLKKMRLKISDQCISVAVPPHGKSPASQFVTYPLNHISYISNDHKHDRAFSLVTKSQHENVFEISVFFCENRKQPKEMLKACCDAYHARIACGEDFSIKASQMEIEISVKDNDLPTDGSSNTALDDRSSAEIVHSNLNHNQNNNSLHSTSTSKTNSAKKPIAMDSCSSGQGLTPGGIDNGADDFQNFKSAPLAAAAVSTSPQSEFGSFQSITETKIQSAALTFATNNEFGQFQAANTQCMGDTEEDEFTSLATKRVVDLPYHAHSTKPQGMEASCLINTTEDEKPLQYKPQSSFGQQARPRTVSEGENLLQF